MNWRKLKIWQETHSLVLEIYRVTSAFPKSETYGLVNQLKRASFSIPANVVEGQSKNTTKEYIHFLYHARGSLEEVRYFLYLSLELKFLPTNEYEKLEKRYESASKMLNGLIKSLKSNTE